MKTFEENIGRITQSMGSVARHEQSPSAFRLGTVLQAEGGRLNIECDGLPQENGELWVNPVLLEGYDPQLEGVLHGSGTCTTHVQPGELTRGRCALCPGDQVVLLTRDKQKYYLLCKVVPV